ncbi:Hypothetical predicted protein [Mytilus galloprovincialis]|uniref:Reverse transcriptase RNase H-like domain-containing protein n=1 Tax=Mytilus galloprovincialis TaxID=29158 RepID=A0A8B6FHR3_MYTGA|nr:Hypothetical predicted protein [Mytilus galloprovincialis]
MLVDTGSVYTLISEALWETLRSNLCTSDRYRCAAGSSTNVPSTLELVREQHKVVSANGEPIDILGKTQLSICIGQEVGIQSVLVARDLAQECILGVDFMRAHKLIIDFDTMALKTKTHNICLKKGNANLACNIKSAKTEIIPAGHEKIIDGKLVAKGRGEIMTTNYVGPADLGRTSLVKHHIETGSSCPLRQGVRRVPIHKQKEIKDHVDNMLQEGIIQPSCSPWAAPVILVPKKDGSTRFCIDYRRINSVTKKDAYPLPRIDQTLDDALAGAKLFSSLDLVSGSWQIELDAQSRERRIQNEKEVVIAYSSRTLSKSERNYCTTRKELLALVFFIKQYRHYLYGKKFRARTDHKALKWLFSMKEPEGQTARWITQLSEYEFSIEHREGKRHRNADGMSRIPCHQCGNDENNIATSAVNRQFCYVQNDTSRRQQELVNKNDTSAGSGTACCSSRITDTSSTLRDQSSNDSFQKAQQEQDKDIYMV